MGEGQQVSRDSGPAVIDASRLGALIARERGQYAAAHPQSLRAFGQAGEHLLGGVPMTWMRMWPGGFPLYLATAHGARLTDIDGNIFTDFCLGDTGAMAGHSPAPVQAAVAQRYGDLGGATAMLPTEDAAWVAAELARRFGPTHWSFTLSATDANRWALRMVRQITGRPKVPSTPTATTAASTSRSSSPPRKVRAAGQATPAPPLTRRSPPAWSSSTTSPRSSKS